MQNEKSQKNLSANPHIPFFELLKSIPETIGIRVNEEPPYTVVRKEGPIEIRRYSKQLQAQVTLSQTTFDQFRQEAFKILASYIFGHNRQQKTVAMTAPVLQKQKIPMTSPVLQKENAHGSWTMSFILPAEYTLQEAPAPLDSRVKLREIEGKEIAALTYTGNNTWEKTQEYKKQMQSWLRTHPEIKTNGEINFAQYDAPFVIPFFKRNEIHAEVALVN